MGTLMEKAHSNQTVTKNKLSKTHMFQLSGFKPAQDPWQLIHSGEGRTLNPHRLKTRWQREKKKKLQSDESLAFWENY